MHYYFINSRVVHGECDYENQYIIASESEASTAPNDADDHITVWNWGDWGSWKGQWLDVGNRLVQDSIQVKIHESEIPLLKKYIPIISVDLATLQPMEDE